MEGQEFKDILNDAETKMKKAVEGFKRELSRIRTGRASLTLLDGIMVNAYDTKMPLNQVATLSTPEGNMILIQAWDKTVVPAIDKAIKSSDLGLNPIVDGLVLKIPIPPLTEERRRELFKHIKKQSEDFKQSIRSIRRDANDTIKKITKEKKVSEDESKRTIDSVQKLTDKYINEIEVNLKKKEDEITRF